jgi:hypothetical protein
MATKETSISIDLDALENQLEAQREELEPEEQDLQVRSTVFSIGKDPRVGVKQQNSVPELQYLEILQDGVHNPYIELHWSIPRTDVTVGNVIGFNVYRKRFSSGDVAISTKSFSRVGFDKIAKGTIKKGKFSSEKKAVTNIRRSLIPTSVLNFNLSQEQDASISKAQSFLPGTVWNRLNSGLNEPPSTSTQSQFENYLANRRDEKIAYVDYTKFLLQ